MDSRLLVRIDALLGLGAPAVVLGAFYPVTVDTVVGVLGLAAVGAGLSALSSYVRGFLVGVADPPEWRGSTLRAGTTPRATAAVRRPRNHAPPRNRRERNRRRSYDPPGDRRDVTLPSPPSAQ